MKKQMPAGNLPQNPISISKKQARRFLLAHQRLWPPRGLNGKDGIMDYIQHVGCIQFDPINVVGHNPDLVLQSRVRGYRPEMLAELLYGDRRLLDGWDKVQSIYLASDWPNFARLRAHIRRRRGNPDSPPMKIAPDMLARIRRDGPLSSIDFKREQTIDWTWGQPTRLSRASLETLYEMGVVGIHHRVHTRRIFDLVENLLPEELLNAGDPNSTEEQYQDWHITRRVGGLGLANPGATDYWLGTLGIDGKTRRAVLQRLTERGVLLQVHIEGIPNRTFYMRAEDLPILSMVTKRRMPRRRAAVIAPLDNLIWDRSLLRWLFDFEYICEVYKPKDARKYGYYVLPVLYGDHFVARFEPAFDKKSRELTIANWWWEQDARVDERMQRALVACLRQFTAYLGVKELIVGAQISKERNLQWLGKLDQD